MQVLFYVTSYVTLNCDIPESVQKPLKNQQFQLAGNFVHIRM